MYSWLRLFLIAAFVTGFSSVYAQSIKLSGKIINQKSEPLPGATITDGAGKQVVADIEGKFYLTLEVGKKYTLTISNAGYEAKSVSEVDVTANQENYLEIVLKENAKSNLTGVTLTSTSRRVESTSALLTFQRIVKRAGRRFYPTHP
jgi:CarboxypepD_reg-like domain